MFVSQLLLASLIFVEATAGHGGLVKPQDLTPVDSAALQDAITEATLSQKAQELENAAYSTPLPNRVLGSPGHANTLDLITGYLDTVGDYYTYLKQQLNATYITATGNLFVNGVDYKPDLFWPMPAGSVEGTVVAVEKSGCYSENFPAAIEGKIALIRGGACGISNKSAEAKAAGAIGAIIYDKPRDLSHGATLWPLPFSEDDFIPTIGISLEKGTTILEAITAGKSVVAAINVDIDRKNGTT